MPVFIQGQVAVPMFGNRIGYSFSASWTVPAGIYFAKIKVIGGAGGNNATPTDANNGAENVGIVAVTPGQVVPVIVGAAGVGATAGGASSAGGVSAVGGTWVASTHLNRSRAPDNLLAMGYGQAVASSNGTGGYVEISY